MNKNFNLEGIASLEKSLGYSFKNREHLYLALTHCSFLEREMSEKTHNQRLEFLGDAVLQLYSSKLLYDMYPEVNESTLSQARSFLVCEESLAGFARKLGVGRNLLIGKGEENNLARDRDSMLADAMEAIIGAIYLDGGEEPSRKLVETLLTPRAPEAIIPEKRLDAKTTLQIKMQNEGTVTYEITGEFGPDHCKTFEAVAILNGKVIGSGTAGTKKNAEKKAALEALEKLTR